MTNHISSTPILIAGAGIGGLTAALALLRKGFSVRVLEQSHQLGEVGAGLQLSANATRALHLLGLGPALKAVAAEPEGKEMRLWSTGQTWKLFDLGQHSVEEYGYPYLMVYRPDLHRVLVEAVMAEDPQAICLNARVLGFEHHPAGVRALLDNGRAIDGAALVGADGVHSRVRKQLWGDGEAHYSGCMAWRGVIPAHRLSTRMLRQVGSNWIGPGRHVIHYPLRRGELMNFVGILETDRWVSESWTQQGTHAECHADFDGWHDEVHELIASIAQPYKWALMARPPLAQWTQGCVTLLGDAAHPTLPFLAQGAVMAIEDGFILSRAFEAVDGDAHQALLRYEAARRDRTRLIVEKSTENGRRFHNPALADAVGATAYLDSEWSPGKVKQRYEWLFRYRVDETPV